MRLTHYIKSLPSDSKNKELLSFTAKLEELANSERNEDFELNDELKKDLVMRKCEEVIHYNEILTSQNQDLIGINLF